MVSLPREHGDRNQWAGKLLEFLRVAHNEDGTVKDDVIEAVLDGLGLPTGEEFTALESVVDDLGTAVLYDFNYGLVGDNVTNDGPAFQAMLDAVPSGGAKLVMTKRTYYLGTGVTTTKTGLVIEGAGATGQDNVTGNLGGSVFRVASGVHGFTFGTASSTIFDGPTLRNMVFRGVSGSLGGVRLLRTNNFRLENVVATGFTSSGSYGIRSDGTGNINQYGTLVECGAHNCHTGIDLILSNGVVLLGGYCDGNSNGGAVPGTGSTGIKIASGDTLKAFGTRVQFYDTGINLLGGEYHELHGVRVEGCTTDINITADDCMIFGGSISNYLIGSGGTGVAIQSGAARTTMFLPKIISVATPISDSGTLTSYFHDRSLVLADSLYIGPGLNRYFYGSATGIMRTDSKLVANLGIGVGNSVAATTPGSVTRKIEVFAMDGSSLGFIPVYSTIT